jgi:hypothetical protein
LDFDDVKAQVGYPDFDEIVMGAPLSTSRDEANVGKFYVLRSANPYGRTNAVMANDHTIAFLLMVEDDGMAYVQAESEVMRVNLADIHSLQKGQGGDDEDSRRRADVIVNAGPSPRDIAFGETRCKSIGDLRPGEYYHCPSDVLFDRAIDDDRSYMRTPVLYLGPAPKGLAYIFGHKRVAQVEVQYLRLRADNAADFPAGGGARGRGARRV